MHRRFRSRGVGGFSHPSAVTASAILVVELVSSVHRMTTCRCSHGGLKFQPNDLPRPGGLAGGRLKFSRRIYASIALRAAAISALLARAFFLLLPVEPVPARIPSTIIISMAFCICLRMASACCGPPAFANQSLVDRFYGRNSSPGIVWQEEIA